MDGVDFTMQLLAHIADENDLINAKFLFQRAPDFVTKRSQSFITTWNACKALHKNDFAAALVILKEPFSPAGQSTNPLKD